MPSQNKPRLIYLQDLFINPSFESEGDIDVLPLGWTKAGDVGDTSTFLKKAGAREPELMTTFNAESEVKGTDTLVINEQDIAVDVSKFAINDIFLLGVWVKSTGIATVKARITTRTGADAVIETATVTEVFGAAGPYTFIQVELEITTLASYDHFKVELENASAVGPIVSFDDVIFGKVLDSPINTGDPGNINIINRRQMQPEAVNSFSLGGVGESLRPGTPVWVFDLEMIRFNQSFHDKLFDFWKEVRKGGHFKCSVFFDKDSGEFEDFHFPYCVVTNEEFNPDLNVGIVRYSITLGFRTVLPFDLA